MKAAQLIIYGLSIPKTIFFNIRCFDLKTAVRLPVFIAYNVRCQHLKRGVIKVPDGAKRFMIAIGFNGTEDIPSGKSRISLDSGSIIFHGSCSLASGCRVSVSNNGLIEFGNNFGANKNFFISCNNHTVFGDDVLIGWNVSFFDANGHPVFHHGKQKDNAKPIYIGDHVWIGSESNILKGADIPPNSIIAYGSLVAKRLEEENAVYGGNPAKKIQDDIRWEYRFD